MPFIPAPAGTVRAVNTFTLQGQECQVVHYHNVGLVDPSAAELLAFANDLQNALVSNFEDVTVTELTFDNTQCTMVETESGLQATSTVSPSTGTVAIASVNNALSALFALGTGLSGRSFRGRMFIPGGRSDNLATDSNYWLSTYLTQLQTAGEGFLAEVNALTPVGATANEWSVASYFSGTDPDGNPIPRAEAVITPIVSITARARIATQRRRRPRS